MAQQKQQASKSLADDPVIMTALIFVVLVVIMTLWKYGHGYVAAVYVYLRYAQLFIFHLLGSFVDIPGVSNIDAWIDRVCVPNGVFELCKRDFDTITGMDLVKSSTWMNLFLWPFLCWYMFKCYKQLMTTNPIVRFSKVHNLDSFIKENEKLYPHLKMFNHVSLIEKSIEDPLYGMSLTTRDFAYKHGLISDWEKEEDGSLSPNINVSKTRAVFLTQLGSTYTGIKNLSPAETILFAIALPRVAATDSALTDEQFNEYKSESDAVLLWCWKQFQAPLKPKAAKKGRGEQAEPRPLPVNPDAWLKPEIDLTYPRSILKKYIGNHIVVNIINGHAYPKTMLFSLFSCARRLGVLPPADIRWLRFYDRDLWYVLQTIGRRVAFAEAGAALSHFLYEARSGEAIVEPQIDKAIIAIGQAVKSYKYAEADKSTYEARVKASENLNAEVEQSNTSKK